MSQQNLGPKKEFKITFKDMVLRYQDGQYKDTTLQKTFTRAKYRQTLSQRNALKPKIICHNI